VDGDPPDFSVQQFAFAGVQTGAELQPELTHGFGDRAGAADCARGAIEAGEEPVPGGIQLTSAETDELSADERVVLFEQLAPAPVA
jgi:hypothetical protein